MSNWAKISFFASLFSATVSMAISASCAAFSRDVVEVIRLIIAGICHLSITPASTMVSRLDFISVDALSRVC